MSSESRRKRLVVCLDGTWNSPNEIKARETGVRVAKPSNVLKISRALCKEDRHGVPQVCYYALGVGALERFPGTSNGLLSRVDRILGGAFGAGFESNVEDAIRFIAHNYDADDELYLFGFSRGAATARAVAQFLDWLGGVPVKRDDYYLPFLFRAYLESRGTANPEEARAGVTDGDGLEVVPLRIRFLGVFDTVMALGGRLKATHKRTSDDRRNYHVREVPPAIVDVARQALAVDERRWDFRPEIWTSRHPEAPQQDLEQRWFAGAHSNIGGGLLDDGLANVALNWMRRAAEAQGLAVDGALFKPHKWFPYAFDRWHDSYTRAYRSLDWIRRRRNRGLRTLIDRPASARLTLDPSVIDRLNADPARHEMEQSYRPENVRTLLASIDDERQILDTIGWKGTLEPAVRDWIVEARSAGR